MIKRISIILATSNTLKLNEITHAQLFASVRVEFRLLNIKESIVIKVPFIGVTQIHYWPFKLI